VHVYVDESGNLGFSETSTKFFIIAYIECESPTQLQTEMTRTLRVLHRKKSYHCSNNELKFALMNQECRQYTLQKINVCDLSVNVVVVEKNRIPNKLRGDLARLNILLVTRNILHSIQPQLIEHKKVNITFDRNLSKWKIEEFNNYVRETTKGLLTEKGTNLSPDRMSLFHVNSISDPGLQAADAIAGAYFQKYEHKNDFYVNLIKDKVRLFVYPRDKISDP
jgi:hypothetical protein